VPDIQPRQNSANRIPSVISRLEEPAGSIELRGKHSFHRTARPAFRRDSLNQTRRRNL